MKHEAATILHPIQAAYLEGIEPARDALLAKMEAHAKANKNPISDPEVASFLAITIRASGAKRMIEVGTNIGYGAIVMARAAGALAHVLTIEKSAEHCVTARAFVEEAGLAKAIDVKEGDAIAELEKLDGVWDLAYVDCVKEDYPRYLELLLPRLRKGGVVIADNVMWRGLVASPDADVPENERVRVAGLRKFNHAITTSPNMRGVILPLGDGVAYAVMT
jgi:caffeoyl-CoA O-methyltransferase